ncbi:MAG TPA: tRNA epoxyqueuosine(34) reductase QueG [Terriglobales bacterium]|nr:tRNA epoxyqueuosine(34) reductase QueG [Terriglobales bacterium]
MALHAMTSDSVKRLALEGGFDAAGVAGVRPEDRPELAYFEQWIEHGHAGEMEYLKKRDEYGRLKRAALDRAAPWAKSVIVCASNYNAAYPYSVECAESDRGWISRYAWSAADYHESVLQRLRQLEAAIKDSSCDPEFRSWCYVDTGPLVERVYAKYAGIGWIGKNTCIISQELGSWLFLGVILTSLELEPDAAVADRCGTCTACIDACPTAALVAPHQLDARRCIAYLTIEKRGEIPEGLREGVGRHIFGCDICQDVCPWNSKSPRAAAAALGTRPELVNPALEWLAAMSDDEFRAAFRGSPVKRAKHSGLRRNVAVAMGNSGNQRFVPALQQMAAGGDPAIAEHARWALARLARVDGASGGAVDGE